MIAEPAPDDLLFESDGAKLFAPLQAMPFIDGTELDYVREGLNEIFKFHNPKAQHECGCGESFWGAGGVTMSRNTEATDDVKTWTGGPLNYKEGFFTRLQTDELAKGINEEVVRAISARRNEPQWMLEFRLNAYRAWLEMEEPHWLKAHYDKLNYQDYSYYSAPSCGNCDETCASEPGAVQQTGANTFLTSEVEEAFNQLGVPVREGREVAVDAIFDSVSVATTYREKLAEQGIIFCSFGEAIHDHPELVKKYLGTVVPGNDNFFAALNAAVASDGTFIYVPKGVRCPMELSTYFRINAEKTGQFERTILVADEGSYVSYIEGCSAPVRDSYQLHAAVVEVIIHKDAEVKYSTVQNWFPGDKQHRRDPQLRHQARPVRRGEQQNVMDPVGNRLGHHLEIPQLHPARR